MEAAGLKGQNSADIATNLLLWVTTREQFCNGLVVQLMNEYQPTFGSNLFKSMVLIVHKLAGIGADKTMNYDERKKLFWYFEYTQAMMKSQGRRLKEPWVYFDKLEEDSSLMTQANVSTQCNDLTWQLKATRYQTLYKTSQVELEAANARIESLQEELHLQRQENDELRAKLQVSQKKQVA